VELKVLLGNTLVIAHPSRSVFNGSMVAAFLAGM
jgi:hypothetical protein